VPDDVDGAAAADLEATGEKLKLALLAARAGIWTWDAASGAVRWSPELEAMHGLESGTFEGTFEAATRDVHPDDREMFAVAVRRAMEEGGTYGVTYRIVLPDGSLRWVEAVGNVLYDGDGNAAGLTGICRDVTERIRAEQAVRASERRFRALFESAAVGVSLIDLEDRFVEVNERFGVLLGYERDELVGRDYRDFILETDELEKAQRQRRELLTGKRDAYSCELSLAVRDGSSLPARAWVSLILDGEGSPRYTVAAIASMAEHRALEEQVRHTQKMQALGQLSGAIAHDFNNLLAVIAVQSGRLLEELATGTDAHDAVLDIAHAADCAAQLTRRLLTFSRREPSMVRVVDLDDVVRGLTSMIRSLIGGQAELVWNLEPGAKPVEADVGQLEQVLMNLVLNARDALTGRGAITTTTRRVELAADDHRIGLGRGDYITLSVTDNGAGIEPANLERIFEPFFTTKEPERGTGLGLTTVYGIVESAGGTIAVESERGSGTTFTVYLPRAKGAAARSSLELRRPAPVSRRPNVVTPARVLLVEDEEAVRRLAEIVLRDAGYAVDAAAGPGEALAFVRNDPHLDLLVTDVAMPDMSGRDLVAAARDLIPELPVLYMTGYDSGVLATDTSEPGRTEVIQKPFVIEDLRAKAAELLGRASGDANDTDAGAGIVGELGVS
jgi:two-component system, cell cycle sensor histidine kinase and response regulator CckA